MKKKIIITIIVTEVMLTAIACGKNNQTETVSDDIAITADKSEIPVSENIEDDNLIDEDISVTNDNSEEMTSNCYDEENTRTVTKVNLAFEVIGDIDVYEYGYVDEEREYVLKEGGLESGTLIHAYNETSDGYYQIEYGTEWGYILKENENLTETDIGYILTETSKEYELLSDFIPYTGPSIHYDKSKNKLLKGEVVSITGIAENGWLETSDGFFIPVNSNIKEKTIESAANTGNTTQTTNVSTGNETNTQNQVVVDTPPSNNNQTPVTPPASQTTTTYHYNHPEAANMTLSEIDMMIAPYLGDDGLWHWRDDSDLWNEDWNTRYQEALDKGWEIPW